jgi:hypothetical protein
VYPTFLDPLKLSPSSVRPYGLTHHLRKAIHAMDTTEIQPGTADSTVPSVVVVATDNNARGLAAGSSHYLTLQLTF